MPPIQYGGIERIVDLLARGLSDHGHDVTLFAHPDSTTPVEHIPWRGRCSTSIWGTIQNSEKLAAAYSRRRFDIIHSFSRLAYLTPILPLRIAKVMSYQREISPRTVRIAMTLARGTLRLAACSRQMIPADLFADAWSVVYNAVSMKTFRFEASVQKEAPLVFLGRIEEIKGPHIAIEIARRAGRCLILAGNLPQEHKRFFEAEIEPHLNGDRVKYIGPVNDEEKNALLGGAAALLMPILWEEPFGIVMAEALACGTPVVGFSRGSVPEVVDHDVTGFVGRSIADLVDGVRRIEAIDRSICRSAAESRFSAERMVEAYLACYENALWNIGRLS